MFTPRETADDIYAAVRGMGRLPYSISAARSCCEARAAA